jgi:hypothetical protein
VVGSRFITVVPSGAPSGHKLSNCSARAGLRFGSTVGYNLLVMEEQCVRPIVCAPDNVSMSSWERPTAEKEFVSCSTVKVGSGSAATASVAMDTNPSYLPAGTDQVAPPACKKQKRSVQNPAMEELWSVPRRSRTARFV